MLIFNTKGLLPAAELTSICARAIYQSEEQEEKNEIAVWSRIQLGVLWIKLVIAAGYSEGKKVDPKFLSMITADRKVLQGVFQYLLSAVEINGSCFDLLKKLLLHLPHGRPVIFLNLLCTQKKKCNR